MNTIAHPTTTLWERQEPNSDIRTEEDLEQALIEADRQAASPMTPKDWADIRRKGDTVIARIKSG